MCVLHQTEAFKCAFPQAGPGGRLSHTLRRASMMLPGAAQHDRHVAFAAENNAFAVTPKEELLGGELVVKIEDATVSL